MTCGAIVVAAGSGVRMGAGVPKALIAVGGRPLLSWCVDALRASPAVADIVVVAPPGREDDVAAALGAAAADVRIVPGGATRAESVERGLAALGSGAGHVLVHDAARPLLTPELVDAVLAAVGDADGAIAAAPLADTPKRVDAEGLIHATPAREGLWLAQTPQAFRTEVLRDATARARTEGRLGAATDCASLVEAAGGRVRVARWDAPNLKVTTPTDVAVAEALLERAAKPRTVG
jgi:2-C-methyl-D-erythritol 4-phosphate cytidylyltransferase